MVSAFSKYPSTEGYIASYRLSDGQFIADISVPSRTYQYAFTCPYIPFGESSSRETICLLLYDRLWTLNPAESFRTVGNEILSLTSRDVPLYLDGYIFTNPSPEPAIHVFDIVQNRLFTLPVGCSQKYAAQPVTVYNKEVLVTTGCDEVYTLNVNHLETRPDWIFKSPNALVSSFVTTNGKIGYVLDENGTILGVNLADGTIVGEFMTASGRLPRGQFVNGLVVNPPYLFALLDSNNLFVFEEGHTIAEIGN